MINNFYVDILLILEVLLMLVFASLSIIMLLVFKKFHKGEFRNISFWTFIVLLCLTINQASSILHPLLDDVAGRPHVGIDLYVDILLSTSYVLIAVAFIMLIKHFKKFSHHFGLVGKFEKKQQ